MTTKPTGISLGISPEDQRALLNICLTKCEHRGRFNEKLFDFIFARDHQYRPALVEYVFLFVSVPYNEEFQLDQTRSRLFDKTSLADFRKATEIVDRLREEGKIGCHFFHVDPRPTGREAAEAFLSQIATVRSEAGELGAFLFFSSIVGGAHGHLPWGNVEDFSKEDDVRLQTFFQSSLYPKVAPYTAFNGFDLTNLLRAMIRNGLNDYPEELQIASILVAMNLSERAESWQTETGIAALLPQLFAGGSTVIPIVGGPTEVGAKPNDD